jgi:Glycosyl hydrolases family 43
MKIIFFSCLFFVVANVNAQQTITIRNDVPRTTIDNKIVDAHDGRVIQFGKIFYWYGTQYGNTNGFTKENTYVCYSSADMVHWKYESALLGNKPDGVFYRPNVVYNKKNKKYILWYNWYPKLWDGQFGVAEADAPTGPFKIINDHVKVKHSSLGVGDLGVFIDENEKAYLSYNTINGHKVSVEALDESYTASTLQGSDFIAEHCEAGSMFKKDGQYFLLTDYTCCFCTQGSGARVFTASNPLGPYIFKQNINRYAGVPAAILQDGSSSNNFFETLQMKERNTIVANFSQSAAISKINLFQFTGNRNGQCGEVDNPILHQPIVEFKFNIAYYSNGVWQDVAVKNTTITNTALQKKYVFSFANIIADKIKITPVYKDSLSTIQIAEINFNTANTNYSFHKTGLGDGYPIIPAQQTYVMELNTTKGKQYIWMGDFWGSATDGVKGKDFQYWSAPLQFYKNGMIKELQWDDKWSVGLK